MTRPLFSCVIPVKGDRPFFEEALSSLMSQGMGDELEIIVQDGDCDSRVEEGSLISRVERVDRVGEERNVRWFRETDAGQSDALNKGFAKARGEWLFWLNSDDVLLPGALKKVQQLITHNSQLTTLNWIVGNQMQIDEAGRVVECSVGPGWHDCLFRHNVPHVYGPSAFFRRELLERVGGLDASLHVCLDWDLWIRFMKAGARFSRIDDYLWTLRQWSGSKTQRPHEADEAQRQWDEVARMLAKNDFTVTRSWRAVLRLWRALNGNYIKQWRDRCRLRGRKAVECVS